MIDVTNKVQIWRKDGKEVPFHTEFMEVKNHWNDKDRVVLKVGDVEVEVLARDLHAAIVNAGNTGARW